jgi:anti-anti-sigma factor
MDEFNAEKINKLNLPFLERVEVVEGLRILRFKGSFNHDTIPDIVKMREEMRKVYETDTCNLLIDFKGVEDVDSSSLAVLKWRLEELKEHHHRMGIINIPKRLMSFIEIFKESSSFEFFESEEDAMKDLM